MLTKLQREEALDQASHIALRTLQNVKIHDDRSFGRMLLWVTHPQLGWTSTSELAACAEIDESVMESSLQGEYPDERARADIKEAAIALLQRMVLDAITDEPSNERNIERKTGTGKSPTSSIQ